MKNLRLSLADWCFYKDGTPADDYYARVKALGYTGVEMAAPERWDAARGAGLSLVNLSGPGMQQGMNRRENHARLIDETLALAERASKNNIPWIIVFSGNAEGQPEAEGIDNCYEGFSRLLPRLAGSGVGLLFEMLNQDDHADYQAYSASYGLALAKRLAHPDFKLLYDVYHLRKAGEDPVATLAETLPYIGHFHIAALEGRRFPSGNGAIDYRAFVKALPDSYPGYVGMEFVTDDAYAQAEAAARLFQSYR